MSTTVLGRPITGEKPNQGRRSRSEQWGADQFIEYLDAVLDLPGVESVKWWQYTPFFNDGDTCEFSVGEFRVRITGEDEEAGDYDDGYFTTYDFRTGTYGEMKEEHKPILEALRAINREDGHFEEFLYDTFGDHAQVVATKAGFDLATYDHE